MDILERLSELEQSEENASNVEIIGYFQLFRLTCATGIPMSVLNSMDSVEVEVMAACNQARLLHFSTKLRSAIAATKSSEQRTAAILAVIAEEKFFI